jgi:hypothetical protein
MIVINRRLHVDETTGHKPASLAHTLAHAMVAGKL